MNHEQLLNDFVDGTLDHAYEASLFMELSANEHLRSDLRAHLMIQRGVRSGAFSYMPERSATDDIFRQLGFSAEKSSRAPAGIMAWANFGRLFDGLMGGVVGALLMAAFMMWPPEIITRGSGFGGADIIHSASAGATSRTGQAFAGNVGASGERRMVARGAGSAPEPVRGSAMARGAQPANPNNPVRVASRRQASAIARPHGAPVQISAHGNTATDIANGMQVTAPHGADSRDSARAIVPVEPAPMLRIQPTQGPVPAEAPSDYGSASPLEPAVPGRSTPIEFEIRHIDARAFARVPALLNQTSTTLLHNMVVGLRYTFNDNFSAGLEFGQEMFYQRFTATLTNGDVVQHKQNPLLPWAGVTLRYNPYRSDGLNPYVEGLAGTTTVGPMGRILLGGYYEILPELRVAAGVELSGIAFKQEGMWYFSPKYGITYGLSVNF